MGAPAALEPVLRYVRGVLTGAGRKLDNLRRWATLSADGTLPNLEVDERLLAVSSGSSKATGRTSTAKCSDMRVCWMYVNNLLVADRVIGGINTLKVVQFAARQ